MKLTPEHIESRIAATRFISRETYERLGTLTICVLELENGFQVIGKSACLDKSTFNAETGRELARKDAVGQIWRLEGYLAASLAMLALPDGDAATSVQDAYDAGGYYGFMDGWFAAKSDSAQPEDIGQQGVQRCQQLIVDDLTSLLHHGFATPARAVQSAVSQAYAAGYAAAKREGQS